MIIRQFAATWSGPVLAAGEFEKIVHIWDVESQKHLATFPTIMDFGGSRLAITSDGENLVAANYRLGHIAAYSTVDGTELWRRKDRRELGKVKVSLNDRRVFAFRGKRSYEVLSQETGKTISRLSTVHDLWESPHEQVALVENDKLVLQTADECKLASIARESFAVLDVAFAPGYVCVSESGGPLRCLCSKTGVEVWRFAEMDEHILDITFAEHAGAFVGVIWQYKRGGAKRLLRFDPESGDMAVVADLGKSGEFVFCKRGMRLLSSNGSVMDSATGKQLATLEFPVEQSGNESTS
jgi:outer membrane protein assembly factor BamB